MFKCVRIALIFHLEGMMNLLKYQHVYEPFCSSYFSRDTDEETQHIF